MPPKEVKEEDKKEVGSIDVLMCFGCGYPNPKENQVCEKCGLAIHRSSSDPIAMIHTHGRVFRGLTQGEYKKKPFHSFGAIIFSLIYIIIGLTFLIILIPELMKDITSLSGLWIVFFFAIIYVIFGVKILKHLFKKKFEKQNEK